MVQTAAFNLPAYYYIFSIQLTLSWNLLCDYSIISDNLLENIHLKHFDMSSLMFRPYDRSLSGILEKKKQFMMRRLISFWTKLIIQDNVHATFHRLKKLIYLCYETWHLVAIELVGNIPIDVDVRHVGLSLLWRFQRILLYLLLQWGRARAQKCIKLSGSGGLPSIRYKPTNLIGLCNKPAKRR